MPAPDSTSHVAVQRTLRMAARAYSRHGLAHAYGHCSIRLDEARFLVCPPTPMGLVPVGAPGMVVSIHGDPPPEALGEVRIHQQIYRRRQDVSAVARTMPPAVLALGVARRVPRALHGLGSYFGEGPAVWDDAQLVRDDATAARVAIQLADRNAIVLRGNGLVVAAESGMHALVLTWYLEDAARLELVLRSAGLSDEAVPLQAAERARRATAAGRIFERMWEYLTAGDPEASEQESPA